MVNKREVLSEQAQLGPDRLKKSRTGSVWTSRLGPDRRESGGRWKVIPMREYILELV